MKRNYSFFLTLLALCLGTTSMWAQKFTVLSTAEDILAHSTEDVSGAKDAFRNVISSTSATEEEITAATQEYVKNATPAPGYAFDMTFQLTYPSVSKTITKTELAKGWFCDVEGVTDIIYYNDATAGAYLRVYDSSKFMEDDAKNTYLLYQQPNLNKGKYYVNVDAFAQRNGKAVTLSAGETEGPLIATGSTLKEYSMYFEVAKSGVTKIGAKRNSSTFNWTLSPITKIAFNNMKLYKLSPVIIIADDATEGLTASTGVDVQVQKTFDKDKYYAICLPFAIQNWRDNFDDMLLWSDAADNILSFKTISSANTQARKPYLVKVKENITADNYLTFTNVDIQSGNPGSWVKTGNDFVMKGNWGTTTLTGNTYYLNDDKFSKSSSTVIPAFSAYIESNSETSPSDMEVSINGVTTGIKASTLFNDGNQQVDVWSIDGKCVKHKVNRSNALNGLNKGLYIINGKKVVL